MARLDTRTLATHRCSKSRAASISDGPHRPHAQTLGGRRNVERVDTLVPKAASDTARGLTPLVPCSDTTSGGGPSSESTVPDVGAEMAFCD